MLDPEFVADCPYAPAAILFDKIVELDRDGWIRFGRSSEPEKNA